MNNPSTVVVVIIIIAAIVGFFFLESLLKKGVNTATNAAATALNKNVIYKKEFNLERQFISEKMIFETTISAEEIMEQIKLTVAPVTELSFLKLNFYELTRKENLVAYSYQNQNNEQFVASVEFKQIDDITHGTFKILRWKEDGGMLVGVDFMQILRSKIQTAIESVDQSAKVSIVGNS